MYDSSRVGRPFHETNLTDKDHLVDFMMGVWESRHLHMAHMEQQWVENIAFFLGHQWSQFDPELRRMVDRYRSRKKVRMVINRLLPMVLRKVASIIRGNPTWKSMPATNDYDDVAVARLVSKVLQGYWEHRLGMRKQLIKLALWTETTGTAFITPYWDKFAGPRQRFQAPGEGDSGPLAALLQIFGQNEEMSNEINGFLGDLKIDVRSPFEIAMDSGATEFGLDSQYLIDTSTVSITWLKNRFPGQKFQPDAGDAFASSRYYIDSVTSMGEGIDDYMRSGAEKKQDRALFHKMWTWPTAKYPDGFYAFMVNERIVDSGPSPYDFADNLKGPPYVIFNAIEVPGRMYGTCSLRQAISPQVALNSGRSHLEEIRRKMGNPKWMVPEGAGVQKSELTGSNPSEFVQYTPGLKPEAYAPTGLPEWLIRLPQESRGDIDDVFSQHAATQGQQPGSVRSGSAIETLVETDAAGNLITLEDFRDGLSNVGSMCVSILSHFIQEERLIVLGGEEFEIESVVFTGKKLVGRKSNIPGANYFQVYTEMVSGAPLTSAGRMNLVNNLIDRQILNVQLDRDRIFKILDLGFEEPYLDEARADRANIRRENMMMAQLQPALVMSYDDDIQHIRGHRHFQKLPEYRSVPYDGRVMFERHIQGHQYRLLMRIQQQAGQGAAQQQQAQPQREISSPVAAAS